MTNLEKYKAEITAAVLTDMKCTFVRNCVLKKVTCDGLDCGECADTVCEWLKQEAVAPTDCQRR